MLKKVLFILILFQFSNGFLFAQDSIINKMVLTKEFNLTTEYLEYIVNKSGNSKSILKNYEYEECNLIIPMTDSSFKLNHGSGKSLINYNNLKEISLKGKNKFGTGLWQGALVGALAGIVVVAIVYATVTEERSNPPREMEGLGEAISKALATIIFPPLGAFIGAVTGGIIGVFTFEQEKYYFKNKSKEEKKYEFLKLIKKHRVSF